MADERDFLDEIIAERTAKNPVFPAMVEAAYRRRVAARDQQGQPSAPPDDDTDAAHAGGTTSIRRTRGAKRYTRPAAVRSA